jgi:hypothetical protein
MTVILTKKRFDCLTAIRKATFRRLKRGAFPCGFATRWIQRPGDTRTPLNPHIRSRNHD